MKLSSFNDGSKDGQLIVVSKDLTKFVYASDIALTMQAAMDNWESSFDEVNYLSKDLNGGKIEAEKFETYMIRSSKCRKVIKRYGKIRLKDYISSFIKNRTKI